MGKSNSKLSQETINELAKSTEFSQNEVRLWHREFMTSCPNGKLSKEEFKEVYNNVFPKGDASLFSEHVFRTFDANRDGFIDFREFICGLSILSKGSLDEKLKWAFQVYDIDSSGYITREEMNEVIKAIYKTAGKEDEKRDLQSEAIQRTDKLFKAMDCNSDSKISLNEFIEGAKKDSAILELLTA